LKKFIRFSLLGGIGVVLYYITLYSLTEFCGIWYLLSSIIASVVNIITSFLVHKFRTFNATKNEGKVHVQFFLYVLITVLYSVTNVALLYILVQFCNIHYIPSQIILTIGLSIINYYVTKKIFEPKNSTVY